MRRSRSRWRVLRSDLVAVLPAFVVARVLVLAGWVVARAVESEQAGADSRALQDGLQAWDGGWYREIAAGGYEAVGEEGLRFFPGFSLLGRVGGWLLGGSEGLVLVVASNVTALLALVLLRRLVLRELGSNALAERSVWVLAVWPASFVLAMAYSEGLFLVCSIATFLFLADRQWALAGLVAAGAALTRPVGLLLALPAAIEAARHLRGTSSVDRLVRATAPLGPIIGCGAYLGWAHLAHGDALAPLRVQQDLRGEAVNPLLRLVEALGDLLGVERLGDGLHLPFAVVLVVALVATGRRLPASYTVYSAAVLVAALAAENLNSLERYALSAFPLMIGLASLLAHREAERAALLLSGAGLSALMALAMLDVYVP